MANKLTHIFFDIDMRSGHPGLQKLALRKKVNLKALAEGECVLFLNRAQNKLKMFASGADCLVYLSQAGKIDAEAIRLLPKYLSGGELNYTAALEESIKKYMLKRQTN